MWSSMLKACCWGAEGVRHWEKACRGCTYIVFHVWGKARAKGGGGKERWKWWSPSCICLVVNRRTWWKFPSQDMKNQKKFEKIGEIPKNVCECLQRSLTTCHWLRIRKNMKNWKEKLRRFPRTQVSVCTCPSPPATCLLTWFLRNSCVTPYRYLFPKCREYSFVSISLGPRSLSKGVHPENSNFHFSRFNNGGYIIA